MARRSTQIDPPARPGVARLAGLVRSSIPPLHPAGLPFVGPPLALAVLLRRHRYVRRACVLAATCCAVFFRNPHRTPPTRSDAAVAPADGQITLVDIATPPAELGLDNTPRPRVGIFLSILDAHIQRMPVTGTVQSVEYRRGRFVSADLADASEVNERNTVLIRTRSGQELVVTQIAGMVARRIVCTARPGDTLAIGQTYGLIRFGSRVDTYLPVGSRVLVTRGQRAVGAETVLAELPA